MIRSGSKFFSLRQVQFSHLKSLHRNLQGLTIGVPRESLDGECRVAITPTNVVKLTKAGAKVRIESNAGDLSGFADNLYVAAGAEIAASEVVWKSQVVAKVFILESSFFS
jgi:alanine dehydrogenase